MPEEAARVPEEAARVPEEAARSAAGPAGFEDPVLSLEIWKVE